MMIGDPIKMLEGMVMLAPKGNVKNTLVHLIEYTWAQAENSGDLAEVLKLYELIAQTLLYGEVIEPLDEGLAIHDATGQTGPQIRTLLTPEEEERIQRIHDQLFHHEDDDTTDGEDSTHG